MAFKMSYGATPPVAPAKAAPAVPPVKKAPRARKGGSLQEKAQALFEPPADKAASDKQAASDK